MSLVHERGGAVALALLASVLISHGAVVAQAHYHLGGIAGIRDTAGPEVWKSRVAGGPDLVCKGDPKVMSNAPEQRRSDFDSAINFASPDQCYQAPKSVVDGENFLVEVWANARQGNASGYPRSRGPTT